MEQTNGSVLHRALWGQGDTWQYTTYIGHQAYCVVAQTSAGFCGDGDENLGHMVTSTWTYTFHDMKEFPLPANLCDNTFYEVIHQNENGNRYTPKTKISMLRQ
jgi:hypothetical protein